ncbi:MAG TPA: sulfatase-like hydrolase/transferase, partial [Pirellulaceae bacterium]|nr:sulfatase-like hydrolase/transferase [Pirellulaceae bacterium]
KDPRRQSYAAMMSAMDDAIGRVVEKLAADKLTENTLIFFISDNGGPPVNASSNGELRGFKATTWEGGVRVPFIANWPGKLPAGKVYDQPVIQLDLLPTALAAAGVAVTGEHKLDGVNLLPYFQGEQKTAPHDKLYWRFGQQTAIRSGDWKLVKANPGQETLLINLTSDIGESKDLSAENPAKRKELETAWDVWNKELKEPLWKANNNPGGKKKKKKAA